MRRLHPVGRHETPVDEGAIRHPDGALEQATTHALPGGRHVVRVEEADGALWHLTLDEAGRPERLQARWREGERVVEATLTVFEDEVLVWRRGAEPASEAVATPPDCRLLWPPIAGRERCLTGVAPEGPAPVACLLVRRRPAARGGLTVRPVKFTAERVDGGLELRTPGRPAARLEVDAAGRLRAWREGDILYVRAG